MRIAYCIMCHKNSKILEQAIDVLHEDNDIYIHVDKKSNLNDFKTLEKKVFIIKERINVKWGNYSQIEATLQLLKETTKKDYDYIFFISGECLPLKNSFEIKSYLKKNKGKEFIGIQNDYLDVEERIKYHYSKWYFKKNKNLLEKIFIMIQSKYKIFKKNRYFTKLPKLYKGPNWFTITSELRDYILEFLEKNSYYKKAFLYSYCGDEVFFQTIICNSKYKKKIYKYNIEKNDNFMALRYVDWTTGPEYPRVLSEDDFFKIRKTDCLFARKFNENLDLLKYKDFFLKNKNIKNEIKNY